MSPVVAFFTGLALLLVLHTHGHLIEFTFLRYLLVWVPVIVLAAFIPRGEYARTVNDRTWPVAILTLFMVLYLFSSSADYSWFYFLSWLPRRAFGLHVFQSQLGQFVILTALLAPVLMFRPAKLTPWLAALLLLAMSGSAYVFIRETGGAFLYHDDHSSFLFRLREFCATFPRQVNYNPFWNGGQISNHPAMSGTSAFGLFLLPFYKWLPIEQCYTPMICVVFIGLVPLMALFSMRIIGADWSSALCAGILALGISQFYFLWLLFYGTVGAVFAAACLMPVSACLFRVLFLKRREKWVGVLLVMAGCVMLSWPPNVVLAAALLAALLINIRHISRINILFLVACGAALILLQLPQIITVFKEILQGAYEKPAFSGHAVSLDAIRILGNGYGNLVDYIRMGHPVLIFLGLGGVLTAVDGKIRRWFFTLVLLLLLVAGWGPEFMPGFQLFRMIIPLFFIAVLPAALAINELLVLADSRFALLRAAVIALLIVGAANTVMLYGNQSQAPYETLPRSGWEMAGWIRSNAPEGTRVLFVGPTIHGYGDGHVAFMQSLAGREMMACDYYHFSPAAVEYEYPPRHWRKNTELFNRFLELYNISLITTWRDNWKGYLRSRPDLYREGASFGEEGKPLAFFKVIYPESSGKASLLLVGDGNIHADFNRLEVELSRPGPEAAAAQAVPGHAAAPPSGVAGNGDLVVIKYNWQAGLVVEKPAEIFPYHAGPGINLIGINPHGQTNVVVRYESML